MSSLARMAAIAVIDTPMTFTRVVTSKAQPATKQAITTSNHDMNLSMPSPLVASALCRSNRFKIHCRSCMLGEVSLRPHKLCCSDPQQSEIIINWIMEKQQRQRSLELVDRTGLTHASLPQPLTYGRSHVFHLLPLHLALDLPQVAQCPSGDHDTYACCCFIGSLTPPWGAHRLVLST